jgi:tetratricopeptide (TPR) repeat protein
LSMTLFQLETAWLHEQVFDFAQAYKLCEGALNHAREADHETSQFLGLILLGIAHSGLGQADAAFECFREITRRVDDERGLMEWIFQMPLRYGLSEYWLSLGQCDRARTEAEVLCNLASQPAERTYLGLGHLLLAEIAIVEGSQKEAEAELSEALQALEGAEAPLAEWRVCASAARLCELQGRQSDADRFWKRSGATLTRLADSLGDNAELRDSLLNHPYVREILDRTD